MAPPLRRTGDGLGSQMATNHFGPFLLTGLLLDQLAASGDGRVVTLSSQMHRVARSAPLGEAADVDHVTSGFVNRPPSVDPTPSTSGHP